MATLGSVSLLGESAVDITAVEHRHADSGWGYVQPGSTPGQLADVAEQATQGLEEVTGAAEGHPRRARARVGKLFTDEQLYTRAATRSSTPPSSVAANLQRRPRHARQAAATIRAAYDALRGVARRTSRR